MVRKFKVPFLHYLCHAVCMTMRMQCCAFAMKMSIIPSVFASAAYLLDQEYGWLKWVLPEKSVYTVLSTLISLAVVFHTVQSYQRWMSGIRLIYQLHGEFYQSAALMVTFASHSGVSKEARQPFIDTFVRLTSMLFTACIGELEDGASTSAGAYRVEGGGATDKRAHKYDLIDPEGLDEDTLCMIGTAADKPGCIYQRLLGLMMHAFNTGVVPVPGPLFTRCFQELGNGMVKFHECLKFKDIPFPLPFMVISDTLLVVHTFYTPFMFASWAAGPVGAGCLTFVSVMSVWLLHCCAEELDNPFGFDTVDLDAELLTKVARTNDIGATPKM